jgi:hypothetical protein
MLRLRPADLDRDSTTMVSLFKRHLNPRYTSTRFDWLYRQNPCGSGLAWLLVNDSDSVVGAAAAFPRAIVIGGAVHPALVLGDFCINEEHRALGPALQLQRACLSDVAKTRAAVCYDFPSSTMLAVWDRLRIGRRIGMRRLARPLRVDEKVRRVIGSHAVAKSVAAVGNTVLALRHKRSVGDERMVVDLHSGVCGDEFSVLAREIGSTFGACISRTPEYLNWRFVANPVEHCDIFTARLHGRLRGYAVVARGFDGARITDVFAIAPQHTIPPLVETVLAQLRDDGVDTASLPFMASPAWHAVLGELGFQPRETVTVVFHAAETNVPEHWFLTAADADS